MELHEQVNEYKEKQQEILSAIHGYLVYVCSDKFDKDTTIQINEVQNMLKKLQLIAGFN